MSFIRQSKTVVLPLFQWEWIFLHNINLFVCLFPFEQVCYLMSIWNIIIFSIWESKCFWKNQIMARGQRKVKIKGLVETKLNLYERTRITNWIWFEHLMLLLFFVNVDYLIDCVSWSKRFAWWLILKYSVSFLCFLDRRHILRVLRFISQKKYLDMFIAYSGELL
jgi:hypothetical protein